MQEEYTTTRQDIDAPYLMVKPHSVFKPHVGGVPRGRLSHGSCHSEHCGDCSSPVSPNKGEVEQIIYFEGLRCLTEHSYILTFC